MKIDIKSFITHKQSENYSDCRDQYAINTDLNRFAISDGVSKSFYPGIWAEILVNKFVSRNDLNKSDFIHICQEEWLTIVQEIVNQPNQKYYVTNKFRNGDPGLATFVGLFFDSDEMMWSANALGDSFLFFLPENFSSFEEQCIKLSSKESTSFDNYPDYYASKGYKHKGKSSEISPKPLQAGTFYLMTDALSEWFITQKEIAIKKIKSWNSQSDFIESIDELRKAGLLNNDDSAILVIQLTDDGCNALSYASVKITSLKDLIILEGREANSFVPGLNTSTIKQEQNTVGNQVTEVDKESSPEDPKEQGNADLPVPVECGKLVVSYKEIGFIRKALNLFGKDSIKENEKEPLITLLEKEYPTAELMTEIIPELMAEAKPNFNDQPVPENTSKADESTTGEIEQEEGQVSREIKEPITRESIRIQNLNSGNAPISEILNKF